MGFEVGLIKMEKLSVSAVLAFQDQSPWFEDSLMMVIRLEEDRPTRQL